MLCLGIRLSLYDLRVVEAELGRGSDGGRLDLGITAAPPCHQRAADSQQGRGVLSDHVQRRQRPHGREVEATEALVPGLCARVDNVNVVDFADADGVLDELAFARGALEQHERRARQGDRERQTGHPRARADVDGLAGLHDRLEFERHE